LERTTHQADTGEATRHADGEEDRGGEEPSVEARGREDRRQSSGADNPPEAAADRPDEADDEERTRRPSLLSFPARHPYATAAVVLAVVTIAAGAVLWWLNARQFEWTDDAFIDARTVSIGAEVAGRITELTVTDNQAVKAGAVLARIDDRDYQARLKQADAQLAEAQAALTNVAAQIDAQKAKVEQAHKQVAQAKAALDFATAENQRGQKLLSEGTGTQQEAQQASSNLRQRQAEFDSAQANVVAAEKQVAVLEAQQTSAQAAIAEAEANQQQASTTLSRTTIVAPVDGYATSISAATGSYAQPGQVLMMFVPREVWVKANFKETQLDLMRPGQPVEIEIDAYPDKTFHGHVDSIQAGSGTAFSLLPAENATGNFVKVVQRVPVKIVFDDPPDVYLGPGLSVVPTVRVR
jgi:membrane fusion protein (multidrug efflux system)